MRHFQRWLLILALVGAAYASTLLLPRYHAIALAGSVWPEDQLTKSMNPWLLADGFSDSLEIEIDWIEGCKPGPLTIEGLRSVAEEYGPSGRPVRIKLDDEIPRSVWEGLRDRGYNRESKLVERYAGLISASADPEFRIERLYVLFTPGSSRRLMGQSTRWFVTRGETRVPVDGIAIYRDPHARFAKLWLSLDKMERMTLVHEFGHMLGLVSNEAHERLEPNLGHCTALTCLMAVPTPRVLVRNAVAGLFNSFPTGFCGACRQDIRRAQIAWRKLMTRDPSYRTKRAAERQADYFATSLELLQNQGKHEEVLQAVRQARRQHPEWGSLASLELSSLTALGRLEEAAALLSQVDSSRLFEVSYQLGRAFNVAGQYDKAIALLDRAKLRQASEYQFEQSSFVLLDALEGARQFDEAISVVDEMLAHGRSISYWPEGMRTRRAVLLLRSGRVDEALLAVRHGLDSAKTRAIWLSVAGDTLDQAGSHDEARAVRREWLGNEEKMLAHAEEPRVRWRSSWSIVKIRVLLGEMEEARAAAARAEPIPEGIAPEQALAVEAPALAAMGDWDRAAEILRRYPTQTWFDVCAWVEFVPMSKDPRYGDLFAHCPRLHLPDR